MCSSKNSALLISLLILVFTACAQEKSPEQKTEQKQVSKIDEFISVRGAILRFQDYKLPNLKTRFDPVECRIRKFSANSEHKYFYQIEKQGEYRNSIASIEYQDVVEVINSIEVLKAQFQDDSAKSPDYLENKFVTTDGFQVGYYLKGQQSSWYIALGNGSDETIFINEVDKMTAAFKEARLKIEELNK